MLSKNDLAKQFELVVKQEIKNYQDSLNFVLQSIDELKKDIKVLNSDMLENYALIHSQHTDLSIQIDIQRKINIDLKQQLNSLINDFRVFKDNSTKERDLLWDASLIHTQKSEFTENRIHELRKNHEVMESQIIGHAFGIRNSFSDIEAKLNKRLCNMKEEILSQPSEALQLKSEMEAKIDIHKIDVAGIMKELLVMKKENMISEKKLEHIYMLIDRLQKKAEENK